MSESRVYSDSDYLNLTEIYFKNEWIRKGTNFEGFENLWFDFESFKSRIILKKLISKFQYVDQEQAKIDTKKILNIALVNWSIKPTDTIFVAFKMDNFSDGSSIILNFIRPILKEIDTGWENKNLFSDLKPGLNATLINKKIKNIILIDDFIGTGGTAIDRIKRVKNHLKLKMLDLNIHVFSLGGMKDGKKRIDNLKIKYETPYLIDKGTKITFPRNQHDAVKKEILKVEMSLYKSCRGKTNFSLGYEKSEALYAWNVFNMPNNNYPMFWWNRYKNGEHRKTMFTRN